MRIEAAPVGSTWNTLFERLDPPLWIVTAADDDRMGGLVATFVMKASIMDDDVRVLTGIGRRHATHELIERSGRLGLHLLRSDQTDVAAKFGMESGRDVAKLDGIPHALRDGIPVLSDCVCWMTANVEAQFDMGDRSLFVCQVTEGADVAPGALMTTERFVEKLDDKARRFLRSQLLADAAQDRIAIQQWRNRRSVS